ncbi:hypothetical protein [Streptomyces lavendofoliae]|uniref:Uncharacterized protein n=1 Tax=Streptomyces lavendofoliae TaxID=67314 RepID=A0A918M7V8_9ACTN|nr:hypothetical protein [Streptomyces lavendofoliae]GGU62077.1 hypothetical protein GCM10010274_58560 [Streptomyces lavendofoliae]
MSVMTIAATALDDNHNPDHARGRADAYDALHDGHTPQALADRLEWMEDPRISDYPAAYLSGYRAQLQDAAASAYALRTAVLDHDDYWTTR